MENGPMEQSLPVETTIPMYPEPGSTHALNGSWVLWLEEAGGKRIGARRLVLALRRGRVGDVTTIMKE